MGLWDRLTKTPASSNNDAEDLKEEIKKQFDQACWDLYVSNLPDPVIADGTETKDGKKTPQEAIPRGFSIDPRTWTVHFNMEDIPKQMNYDPALDRYLTKKEKNSKHKEKIAFSRSIFHHEIGAHFAAGGGCPGDGVTEAILIDSALASFNSDKIKKNKQMAHDCSFMVLNIMGDLIGDTYLAKERYGRENFGDLTLWREKEIIKEARQTPQTPSLLWQTLVRTYEKLWKEDLGLDQVVQNVHKSAETTADELVKIMANDWKDRSTWEDKIKKFARTLEPIILHSANEAQNQSGKSRYQGKGQQGQGQGQGGGLPVPDDVKTQMGENATESPLAGKNGNGEKVSKGSGKKGDKDENNGNGVSIDERVLDEIYQRNKENPGKFAGTMSALKGLDPDDALRLMYRARARELLVTIEEKQNQKAQRTPSYRTAWCVGDPIVGKGGLDFVSSMMSSGKPIPNLTTEKRKMEESVGHGTLKMIPDLFIVIDSSGSMDWKPWINPPDARGDFDKAILAAEAAALYAIDNGGQVAVINHSAERDVTIQEYTRDINKIEMAIMKNYSGGTVVPVEQVKRMIKKTNNPLLTCYMSDCAVDKPQKACDEGFAYAITDRDTLAIFYISPRYGSDLVTRLKDKGAIIYPISRIQDLAGLMIGQVKKTYEASKKKK